MVMVLFISTGKIVHYFENCQRNLSRTANRNCPPSDEFSDGHPSSKSMTLAMRLYYVSWRSDIIWQHLKTYSIWELKTIGVHERRRLGPLNSTPMEPKSAFPRPRPGLWPSQTFQTGLFQLDFPRKHLKFSDSGEYEVKIPPQGQLITVLLRLNDISYQNVKYSQILLRFSYFS